jgi:hypothetical protein
MVGGLFFLLHELRVLTALLFFSFRNREKTVSIRATKFSLIVIATMALGGCSSEHSYNIPTDASKEAVDLRPAPTVSPDRKKITKPPGPALKGAGVKSFAN